MVSAITDQLDRFGPDGCPQLTYEQAAAYTRQLAQTHYENFSVVSWFLPRPLREDFRNVYAFCRWADDLGDQIGDTARSRDLLCWWRRELDACYADCPRHPVFVALHRTIRRHDIPRKPFDDLVDAFLQDQTITRYDSWQQVLDYCTRSANPVGRLVLYMCGYRDEKRQSYSDATCTALQLTNFWQDVRRDILERDRVYMPADVAVKHGLDIEALVRAVKDHAASGCHTDRCCSGEAILSPSVNAWRGPFGATLRELVGRTWPLFRQGQALWPMVKPGIRLDIRLFTLGGQAVLTKIQKMDYHTLVSRPRLSKPAKAALVVRALAMHVVGMAGGSAKWTK